MSVTEAPNVSSQTAREPSLARGHAMHLAATEYQRFVAAVQHLGADDWTKPTACPAWNVHAMVCHVLGMAEYAASRDEHDRQVRAAHASAQASDVLFIDALTSLQVSKHVHRSPEDLTKRLVHIAAQAAAGRRQMPDAARRATLGGQPLDEKGLLTESWTAAYLNDVILTRDTWMHRSDLAAATGGAMTLTPSHDGVIVADVATEWADRHQQPCALTLTGPAGGSWTFNGPSSAIDVETYELDAVEFCRILSGRGDGEGLLSTRVPF